MKNVENFADLQEMSLQEMEEVNGGLLGMFAGAYLGYAVYCIMEHPGKVLKGIMACV